VPGKLCTEGVVSELSRLVLESDHREDIFQGPHHNDGKRVQAKVSLMKKWSKGLNKLIAAVLSKLKAAVPCRPVHDDAVTAIVSLGGCGPQRTHCDYACDSLDGVRDDGWCGGLPV
jgi:hypothetical protein